MNEKRTKEPEDVFGGESVNGSGSYEPVISVLVCQSQAVLDHKMKDGKKEDERYCFWRMARFPRRIKEAIEASRRGTGKYSVVAKAPGNSDGWYDEDDLVFEGFHVRLYFAVNGVVQGFFACRASDKDLTELRFHSNDWFPTQEQVKIKPSQGWRYFDD